ncbi:glycoside hydrolase family 3 C-terminal domain-containing protein, partial [bacterium]|nr:glycoside hydrolase family 3 C-terminal domain-containing protein [bacterium]
PELENKISEIIAKMTIEEKIDMLGGHKDFCIRGNERLGIPEVKMSDGPVGVRTYGQAPAYPATIGLAASFDRSLAKKMGQALGKDCQARGVNILLAPAVNIYRAPMCGRNFEYTGEDPYLAGEIAVGYITGLQGEGIVATVKHFAANNQEWDRHTISSNMSERTLREIYLPAFKAAVRKGGVQAVMTSYNLLNGIYASQHQYLISEILKGEWGFDGFVMSDWVSVYDGVAAANAGLDLEMPSAVFMNQKTLLPAIKAGEIRETTIDDKIRRMLRVMFRMGFFETAAEDKTLLENPPESAATALEIARGSQVLLKNKKNILPLNAYKINKIAVVGPNANPAVTGAGGSSYTAPFEAVSLLDAVRNKLPHADIEYQPGVFQENLSAIPAYYTAENGEPGLKAEYFKNSDLSGAPLVTRIDKNISFFWAPATNPVAPSDQFSARWTGKIKTEKAGYYQFFLQASHGYRMWVNGKKLYDCWEKFQPVIETPRLKLNAESWYDIVLEASFDTGRQFVKSSCHFVDMSGLPQAIAAAKSADAVIVSVGFWKETEAESFDRPFGLPFQQVELIKKIAKVNPKTIVVLNAGGNADIAAWLDNVAGLIHAWYPGQNGNQATAEILFGELSPSGKLPISIEKKWKHSSSFGSYYDADGDKTVNYDEGVFVGYRHFDQNKIRPLFPFGFGLSYTKFSYANPDIRLTAEKIEIAFDIRNTGAVAGAETAQIYIHDRKASVPRPPKELKGFEKVFLTPGQTKQIFTELPLSSLAFFDEDAGSWVIEPGEFEIRIGSSSRDIRLTESITVSGNLEDFNNQ